MALFVSICADAQDSLFHILQQRSAHIVSATVLNIGSRIRMEDGIVEYNIRAVVNESFQGTLVKGDTIHIHIVEFTMNLGGKYREDGDALITVGETLVFFLDAATSFDYQKNVVYKPVDSILGVMQPSEQLLSYLRIYTPR